MRTHALSFALAAACAVACAAAPSALAQGWPSKPVRVIVPHAAGGPVDTPARGFAQELGKVLGQPFVVESREGADGLIGAEACAKAPPDGHTLCVTTSAVMTINPLVRLKLPYDAQRDFAPVMYYGALNSAFVVHPSLKASTMRELLALAKARPGALTFATYGNTSFAALFIGWAKAREGASFYAIPYKNTIGGLQAAVAGDVQVASYAPAGVAPHARAGKVRPLAVTGEKRSAFLPDVPTVNEAGLDFEYSAWVGMFAPGAVPREVVTRLNAESAQLAADPAFARQWITRVGLDIDSHTGKSPQDFAAFLRQDYQQIGRLIELAGIRKE